MLGFCYSEHLVATSSFLCIALLVVSGRQCTVQYIIDDSFIPPVSEGWGRCCFHRCLSTPGVGRTLVPCSFLGQWYQVHCGGCPSPMFFPRLLVPGPFWGIPQPWPGQDGVPTRPGQDRVPPPGQVRMRYPTARDWGTPHRGQNSRASTCYAAGGMPLAFRQDDFLVWTYFRMKRG